jgi:hypothetical protein
MLCMNTIFLVLILAYHQWTSRLSGWHSCFNFRRLGSSRKLEGGYDDWGIFKFLHANFWIVPQITSRQPPYTPIPSHSLNHPISLSLSMALHSFSDLGRFSVSWSYTQSAGHLGRGLSPSNGRYLHTEQHNHTHTDIHASSRIRTPNCSVRAAEDGSCLRPRSHCDRRSPYRNMLLSVKYRHCR